MTTPAPAPHPVIDDPDGHFPYKEAAAVAGHPNPHFGEVDATGKPHQSAHVENWVVMPEEAAAAAACVAAQEAHHRDWDNQELKDEVERTSKELNAVRRKIRIWRNDPAVNPAGYVSGDQFPVGRS